MKITIRTNPEMVIEVEPIAEEKKVEQTIAVPDPKVATNVKSEPAARIEKGARASGIARNAARPDTDPTTALKTEQAQGPSKRKSSSQR